MAAEEGMTRSRRRERPPLVAALPLTATFWPKPAVSAAHKREHNTVGYGTGPKLGYLRYFFVRPRICLVTGLTERFYK